MRVNLTVHPPNQLNRGAQTVVISLMIEPSRGQSVRYTYTTDSPALIAMLKKADLPAAVLDRFKSDLLRSPKVRLSGIDLSDEVLSEIGYFH